MAKRYYKSYGTKTDGNGNVETHVDGTHVVDETLANTHNAACELLAAALDGNTWLRDYGFHRSLNDENMVTYWLEIYWDLYDLARRGELPLRDIRTIKDLLGVDKL